MTTGPRRGVPGDPLPRKRRRVPREERAAELLAAVVDRMLSIEIQTLDSELRDREPLTAPARSATGCGCRSSTSYTVDRIQCRNRPMRPDIGVASQTRVQGRAASRTRVPGRSMACLVRGRMTDPARPGTSVGARDLNQSDFSPLSARIPLRTPARAPAMAPAGLPKVEAENRAGPVLAVKECA